MKDPRADTGRAELEFLRAELTTGLTLSRIALDAKDEGKVDRNRVNARKAYDSVLHYMPKTFLPTPEWEEIKSRLAQLKAELKLLGEDI